MMLPMQRLARSTHPACRVLIVHRWALVLKPGRVIALQIWQESRIPRARGLPRQRYRPAGADCRGSDHVMAKYGKATVAT